MSDEFWVIVLIAVIAFAAGCLVQWLTGMRMLLVLLLLSGCGQSNEPPDQLRVMNVPLPVCVFTRGDRRLADTWPAHIGERGEIICREEDAPK